jgi:hypothetical protein
MPLAQRRGVGGRIWINASGEPLVRMTGGLHDWTSALQVAKADVGKAVLQLILTIKTGEDDLRAGSNPKDNADAILKLQSGQSLTMATVTSTGENDGATGKRIRSSCSSPQLSISRPAISRASPPHPVRRRDLWRQLERRAGGAPRCRRGQVTVPVELCGRDIKVNDVLAEKGQRCVDGPQCGMMISWMELTWLTPDRNYNGR